MSNNLFWFRRDLRIDDNHGLSKALQSGTTLCCFIYDKNILEKLDTDNKGVGFINQSLLELKNELNKLGSDLLVMYGQPQKLIKQIVKKYKIDQVYANEDYEQYAIKRDSEVAQQVQLNLFKDHVIFAKKEVVKKDGTPYTKFSVYKNAWLKILHSSKLQAEPFRPNHKNFMQIKNLEFYEIQNLKFNSQSIIKAGSKGARARLKKFIEELPNYAKTRNIPYLDNTSRLSVDLRFGTISIRNTLELAQAHSNNGSEIWLNELIWREFFSQVLYNFPHVENKSFKAQFVELKYSSNKTLFKKWCEGATGYPIVDAGMRQLNETGFMHNRLRLITATFLVKDLLIDWRWGEEYFANKLIDYELASNNGNWQWCASTGCDSQPYFRIFNPNRQASRFDPDAKYIIKYIPELKNKDKNLIINTSTENNNLLDYHAPIVNHEQNSRQTKQLYKEASKVKP